MLIYYFDRGRHSQSNGTITNVVLYHLDLNLQSKTPRDYFDKLRLEKSNITIAIG